MAQINRVENTASIVYNSQTINSNQIQTLLLLPPTIRKAVDKPTASIGQILTYTVTITNVAIGELTNIPFSDVLPQGTTYVKDSFKVNGTAATPTLEGNTLKYTIPQIGSLGIATLQFQVNIVGGEE